jgi:hypothetical protein
MKLTSISAERVGAADPAGHEHQVLTVRADTVE